MGGGWRRGGRAARRSAVAAVTTSTACSNASTVAGDVDCTPLTFRTYWRAAAAISSGVAPGSSPRSVVMFRHMSGTLPSAAPAGGGTEAAVPAVASLGG